MIFGSIYVIFGRVYPLTQFLLYVQHFLFTKLLLVIIGNVNVLQIGVCIPLAEKDTVKLQQVYRYIESLSREMKEQTLKFQVQVC